jgi:hypothetical protein
MACPLDCGIDDGVDKVMNYLRTHRVPSHLPCKRTTDGRLRSDYDEGTFCRILRTNYVAIARLHQLSFYSPLSSFFFGTRPLH